ncbi:MAG: hypothetical protein WCI04_02720 [archaeon]
MAMQTLKSIDYMSALKVGAISGLVYGILVGIMMLGFASMTLAIPGAEMAGGALGIVGFVMAIIMGVIGGAIGGIVSAGVYNIIIVKLTGGMKIELV